MMRLLPALPLLSKELIEQAVRKRTYVLRSAYALALLIGFALIHQQWSHMMEIYQQNGFGNGLLGQGAVLFNGLCQVQFWAIAVVMPALTAGAITQEKESGSFTLLLLTSLRPWELLAQKWLSRLIVVGSYLLLSLPLMAVAYAYGGITAGQLWIGVWALTLACLQSSAVALALSCWCRSSVTAFVGSYLALSALYWLVPELIHWLDPFARAATSPLERPTLLPADLFDLAGTMYRGLGMGSASPTAPDGLWSSRWILGSIAIAILVARIGLIRRATATGGNPLLRLFRWLDRTFEGIDVRMGLKRGNEDLPERDPVAWREFNRRSLANWRYLLRIMLPLALVGLVCVLVAESSRSLGRSGIGAVFIAALMLALLLMLVLGASLIAGERMDQTLDVLLTTPLTAGDILAQKVRGLRRISIAAFLLLLLVEVYRGSSSYDFGYSTMYDWSPWTSLLGSAVLLPLASWFGIWIGLMVRNRNRAVVTAVIAAGAAIFGGAFAITLVGQWLRFEREATWFLLGLVPGMTVIENELGPGRGNSVFTVVCSLMVHVLLWQLLRRWCFQRADHYLRRNQAGA